jgi:serine/threonine-protein kinase
MADESTRLKSNEKVAQQTLPPVAPEQDDLPVRLGRYLVEGEIARGRLGVVLRVADPEFGRTLAVKLLPERLQDTAGSMQRFLEVARIHGQLQHTGIPPVHEKGTLLDGRPYFAMKLVQGETLADLLAKCAGPGEGISRFLGIFEQICQTVAYAHSKGIIHRDLTPSNVMVGAFGEVQVMDWGSATRLADPKTEVVTGTVADASEQRLTGQVNLLGTPAFIPPEQAGGQFDQLDQRADVFALGAILCVILTGRPPYQGENARSIAQQAVEGNLAEARVRLGACLADEELVRLALACLASNPAERPRDAGAVATAVAVYRVGVEERLRHAEVVRATADGEHLAAKQKALLERKRRRVTLAVAVSGSLFLTVAGGFLLWWQLVRVGRIQRTWENVQTPLVQADRLQAEASKIKRDSIAGAESALALLNEARAAIEQAKSALPTGIASNSLKRQIEQARLQIEANQVDAERSLKTAHKDALFLEGLQKARDRLAMIVENDFNRKSGAEVFQRAFATCGHDVTADDGEVTATWVKGLPKEMREAAVFALHDWWLIVKGKEMSERLWSILERADGDDWRRRFRAAVKKPDVSLLQELLQEAHHTTLSPGKYLLLSQVLASRRQKNEAVELLRWARLTHEKDFWLSLYLGVYRSQPSEPRGTDAQLEEAAGCFRTARAIQRDSVAALHNLGVVLMAQHKTDQAVVAFRKALAVTPPLAPTLSALGNALEGQHKLEEAVKYHRLAIEIDPTNAPAHYHLGNALKEQHKLDEAIKEFDIAIRIDPRNARAYVNEGKVLQHQNKLEEAVGAYRKALELDNADAAIYSNLGLALAAQYKLVEAVAAHRKAVEIDPRNASYHSNLGMSLQAQNKPEDAIIESRKAVELDPTDPSVRSNLGLALAAQNKLDEAIAAHRKAIEIDPGYARAYSNLGNAFAAQNKLDEAIAAHRKAIAIDPVDAEGYYALGHALQSQQKLDEAVAAFRQALVVDPKLAQAHGAVGSIYLMQGRFAEGKASTQRALALVLQGQPLQRIAAQQLEQCDRLLLLEAKATALLKGETRARDASENVGMAVVCRIKQQHAAAVRFYAAGFTAEPRLADDLQAANRYLAAYCAVRAASGQGQDAPADKATRSGLRQQALAWLRADLLAWTNRFDGGTTNERARVRSAMHYWQQDPSLSIVRHPWSLLLLPDEERNQWQKLWMEVAALAERS